jgi:hypothetical protein
MAIGVPRAQVQAESLAFGQPDAPGVDQLIVGEAGLANGREPFGGFRLFEPARGEKVPLVNRPRSAAW